MGEMRFGQRTLVKAVEGAIAEQVTQAKELPIATPGGRFQVRWDENGSASALGQLAFFAEFLEATGLFERWVESCPLSYTRAPMRPRSATYSAPGCSRSSMDSGAMRMLPDYGEMRWRRRFWA